MFEDRNRRRRRCGYALGVFVALVVIYNFSLSDSLREEQAKSLQLTSRSSGNSSKSSSTEYSSMRASERNRGTADDGSSAYFWKMVKCSYLDEGMLQTQVERDNLELNKPDSPFLEDFKNPCWTKDRNPANIRCIPYFYIIGQSKCGTGDLWTSLLSHPNVTSGSHKEYWWWNLKRVGLMQGAAGVTSRYQSAVTLDGYSMRFAKAAAEIKQHEIDGIHYMVTGDATASYLWNTDGWPAFPGNRLLTQPRIGAAHYLRAVTPGVKLLVILRNPVDRLYSDYYHQKRNTPLEGNPDDFHSHALAGVRMMNDCMTTRGIRECLYDTCLHAKMLVRLRIGLYHLTLVDWLKVFKRDQFKIIRTEDYSKDRASVVDEAATFLQIGHLPSGVKKEITDRQIYNKRKVAHTVKGPMLPETRKLLEDFHRPFNKKLADLLDDKRFLWQ